MGKKDGCSKHFTTHDLVPIQPLSNAQRVFVEAYDTHPVIVTHGLAGTGKTLIALHCMLHEMLEDQTGRIIIIRSAVQAREIGFLPGCADEKNETYEQPYKNIFDELFKHKSNNYKNLKGTGKLEFHNTSFLRGLTFDNSLIIVDEFQSMTYHELSTIITRVGLNSRIIFCGDSKQCDLHKRGDESGIDNFMRVLQNMPGVAFIDFGVNDIVRSGVVKDFLIAENVTFSGRNNL